MSDNQSSPDSPAVHQGRAFVWHEVYAPTSASAIDFYTKALEFGTTEMDMGPMGSYKMLTRNGVPVCGVVSAEDMPQVANVPPHWATYISVDDVDARIKKCEEHGGKLIHGPHDVPTVGRMALVSDPNGATFWLFKPMPA